MLKKFCFFCVSLVICFRAVAQIPPVKIRDIEGKVIETAKVSNQGHPIVLSFFATWCKPCLRELSAIDELYQEWQEQTSVKLIAVSIDEGVNTLKVKPLVRSKGWTFDVWLDSNKDLMNAMNAHLVPSVFVFDGQGKIVYRHTGYVEGGEYKLFEEIKKAAK